MGTKKKQKIRALEMREQCRKKVHVWFGSKSNQIHPVAECVLNGYDEVTNNFDHGIIEATLWDDDQTVTIADTGRGIPLEEVDEETGDEMWKLLLMTLFAGGKYDEEEDFTTGTNGCGLTVTQYCSDYFEVISKRNGKIYRITFRDGGREISGLEVIGETEETGTSITFKLSPTVFTTNIMPIEAVKNIVEHVCVASNKVTGIVNYKGERFTYHYNEVKDYFAKYAEGLKSEIIVCPEKEYENIVEDSEGEELLEKDKIQLIFASTTGLPLQETFLNATYLPQNGTIYDGIVQGMRGYLHKYATKKDLYKKEEKNKGITNRDIELSISFVCNLLSNNVEFEGQTKFLTKKGLYQTIAKDYVTEQLEIIEKENPKELHKIANQAVVAMRARVKSTKMLEDTVKKLSEAITIFNRPEGLLNCKNKDPRHNRLFIAEGRSAKTGLAQGRDKYTDAIIAIRGKILNCLKADWVKIFKNDVIVELVRVFGCGVSVKTKENKEFMKFDRDKCNYGQFIIATDSDVDGMNIRCLLLTMIYVLMPELFGDEELDIPSLVWIVEAPLFEIECEGQIHFAITEEEKDEILKDLKGKKYIVNRNKGLGEMDGDSTAQTIMNPEYRGLYQVTMKDVEKAKEYFEIFMGEKVEPRRNYILEHFEEYAYSNAE